jgi:hypothetical protein
MLLGRKRIELERNDTIYIIWYRVRIKSKYDYRELLYMIDNFTD